MAFALAHDFSLNQCTFYAVEGSQTVTNYVTNNQLEPAEKSLAHYLAYNLDHLDSDLDADPVVRAIEIQRFICEINRDFAKNAGLKGSLDDLIEVLDLSLRAQELLFSCFGTPICPKAARLLEAVLRNCSYQLAAVSLDIKARDELREDRERLFRGLWNCIRNATGSSNQPDNECTALKQKLEQICRPLLCILAAMTSASSIRLVQGSDVRSAVIEKFYEDLWHRVPSIVHISFPHFTLTGPWKDKIHIAIAFCSSMEDLDRIIRAMGLENFHSYKLVHQHSKKAISPQQFSQVIRPSAVFAMSALTFPSGVAWETNTLDIEEDVKSLPSNVVPPIDLSLNGSTTVPGTSTSFGIKSFLNPFKRLNKLLKPELKGWDCQLCGRRTVSRTYYYDGVRSRFAQTICENCTMHYLCEPPPRHILARSRAQNTTKRS